MLIEESATLIIYSVRRSGGQRDLRLLKLIPLLRTELERLGLVIYKHLTPNGVKAQPSSPLFPDRLLKQVAGKIGARYLRSAD